MGMKIASNTSNLSFRAKALVLNVVKELSFPQQSSASTTRSFARPVRFAQGKLRMTNWARCASFPALIRKEPALSLAVFLCVLGLPSALPAMPYFPPDTDSRSGEEKPSGEFDKDDEEILLMEETVVEGTFEDPFATESEPVQDPWEPFNSSTFTLNYNIDRYALKPAARVYSVFVPPDVQDSLGNAFDNLGFVSRFLNSVFQGKFGRAGTEMQRFLLNSTLGVGGLFDVATHMFGIEVPPAEDTGQTLATYGVASGPYLVLPLLPPMTVRDAVGYAGDIFMNPVNYFIPFAPNLGLNATDRVNDRAVNLETFEGLEESTIDLYGAVRSGYMDRRAKDIQE
jgi:phospholipid-binding lipoprotein MlaA